MIGAPMVRIRRALVSAIAGLALVASACSESKPVASSGPPTTTVAPSNGAPMALAADGDDLYWVASDHGVGRVLKAPVVGGAAAVLAEGLAYPQATIAVDRRSVY